MVDGIYFWSMESTLDSTFGGWNLHWNLLLVDGIYFGIYFWWMESTLESILGGWNRFLAVGIYFWRMESTFLAVWERARGLPGRGLGGLSGGGCPTSVAAYSYNEASGTVMKYVEPGQKQ